MHPQHPSRRRALAGGIGALAAARGGVNMQGMLDDFSAGHPEIALEAATLQWGAPYYTKLGMAGAGGRAPELAVLHLARLAGFAPGKLVDPFDLDLLAEHGVREKDFPPDIWRRGRAGGKQYAVPFDTHPFQTTKACAASALASVNALRRYFVIKTK